MDNTDESATAITTETPPGDINKEKEDCLVQSGQVNVATTANSGTRSSEVSDAAAMLNNLAVPEIRGGGVESSTNFYEDFSDDEGCGGLAELLPFDPYHWKKKNKIRVPSGVQGDPGFIHFRRPPEPGQHSHPSSVAKRCRRFDNVYASFPTDVGESIEAFHKLRYFTGVADRGWTAGLPIPLGTVIPIKPPPGSTSTAEAFGTSIFMGLIYDLVTEKWYIVIHNPVLCMVIDEESCIADGVFLVHAEHNKLDFTRITLVEKDTAMEILFQIMAALTDSESPQVRAAVRSAITEASATLADLVSCVDAVSCASSKVRSLATEHGYEETKENEAPEQASCANATRSTGTSSASSRAGQGSKNSDANAAPPPAPASTNKKNTKKKRSAPPAPPSASMRQTSRAAKRVKSAAAVGSRETRPRAAKRDSSVSPQPPALPLLSPSLQTKQRSTPEPSAVTPANKPQVVSGGAVLCPPGGYYATPPAPPQQHQPPAYFQQALSSLTEVQKEFFSQLNADREDRAQARKEIAETLKKDREEAQAREDARDAMMREFLGMQQLQSQQFMLALQQQSHAAIAQASATAAGGDHISTRELLTSVFPMMMFGGGGDRETSGVGRLRLPAPPTHSSHSSLPQVAASGLYGTGVCGVSTAITTGSSVSTTGGIPSSSRTPVQQPAGVTTSVVPLPKNKGGRKPSQGTLARPRTAPLSSGGLLHHPGPVYGTPTYPPPHFFAPMSHFPPYGGSATVGQSGGRRTTTEGNDEVSGDDDDVSEDQQQ